MNHRELGYIALAGPSLRLLRALRQLVELAFAEFAGEDDTALAAQ